MSEASYRGEHARLPLGGSLPGLPARSDPPSFDQTPAPLDQ